MKNIHMKIQALRQKATTFFQQNQKTLALYWTIVAVFPLYLAVAANYISYASIIQFVALLSQNMGAFLLGVFLSYLLCGAFACLFRRIPAAAGTSALVLTILPLVDYFKNSVLKEHFVPWDLLFAKNADSFITFLTALDIGWEVVAMVCLTILYWIFLFILQPELPIPWKKRIFGSPVLFMALCLFLVHPSFRTSYETCFGVSPKEPVNQTEHYAKNGFLAGFAVNFGSMRMSTPENYNEPYLKEAFAQYVPKTATSEEFQNPDIIVILSESFWDPLKLKNVSFSADPLKNYRRIAEKHPSGSMVSCTFGGGTVRPEFEILTGMTTNMLPSGNVPYPQYVHDNIFSYARHFKNQGYDTIGIHTYQKEFYERNRAYPLLGFDDFLGEYDLHAEHHWNSGPYIKDETITEEIMYQLEQPHETGVYIMAITMENHGLYIDKYEPFDWDITVTSDVLTERNLNVLHNYCKGTADSDAELGRLYDYVMQREKPTVVLWYGDHLPTLGGDFEPYTTTGNISSTKAAEWSEEEKYRMFSTPYVIFANYDTGRDYRAEDMAVSPFMLSPLLCDYIAAPESTRTNFLLDLFEICPVISPYYNLYAETENIETRDAYIRLHELLTYDDLMGKQYLTKDLLEGSAP